MVRRYDSSRRKKAAEQTRQDIIRAALKLHWEGITEFGPLAHEAGCSVPTVRKHFPTKESLFRDCTRTFGETLTMPDLAALGEVTDPGRRLKETVAELCRIHEAMFGYAWLCAHLRDESSVLDAEMTAYEGLADAVAEIIVPEGSPKAAVVRGFLDYLTYRALRLAGGLSPEKAREELIATLVPLIEGGK
jgi:AcrR family transcriptional regulator